MSTGAYMNGPEEPLTKAFAGSIATHALVVGLIVTSGLWNFRSHWGSEQVSSGSVGVTMVKTIPLPRKDAPLNPLASDSTSVLPQAPAPVKMQKKVEAPIKNAIPIPDKFVKPKKLSPRDEAKSLFRPPAAYKQNQLYSTVAPAASTPLYGMKGSAGIDIGPTSVLGSRFGGYVDLMRDRISQHWLTAGMNASAAQKCAISFVIARNGMVTNVQISKESGNYLLDTSAKRAILDSSPLPPLPREFTQNEATVELWFQLQK